MPESPEQLLARLAEWSGVNRYLVAFSGGLDSSVLLHAMASLAQTRPGMLVSALHVHHGLHPDADAWTAHCRAVCIALGIPLEVAYARISQRAGDGPEDAARNARYHLLAHAMQPNDGLLTAHHADDQIETLLMRLVRGAGVEGLAGIPSCRAFGPGRLLRPLLSQPRTALVEYARSHGLGFLEDPSNADSRFDRNYLRREILPRLKARWPAATAGAVRSAEHLSAASRLMGQIAAEDLDMVCDQQGALNVVRLASMPAERLHNLLRYWIRARGHRMPSTAKLAAVVKEAIGAGCDAVPCVTWQGAEVRRFRNRLFLMPPLAPAQSDWCQRWNPSEPLALPAGLGRLLSVREPGGGIDGQLLDAAKITVRFRQGGERIRPVGCDHHRTLRNLCQEGGVFPWMRERMPLLYIADDLAAVADLWIADEFAAASGTPGVRLCWEGQPGH